MMQAHVPEQNSVPPPAQPPTELKDAVIASPKELMNKLLTIMGELNQVMVEEMPIIEARDYSKQDKFIKRKHELTLDYQSMMKVLSQNEALIKALSKDDVIQLRTSGQKLDEAAQKNAAALRFAHHATENLMRVVINEIRKDMHKESGYSGRGVMALAESYRARPISVNQRV